ncbi:MAG: hypothetical protein KKF39_04210 [Nanoarchaeota archaeon]|nr:hypothetical protein [Nanoarchaeota archaeon]
MKKNKFEKKFEAVFQIVLLLGMIFSFSYFAGIVFDDGMLNKDGKEGRGFLFNLYRKIIEFVFDEKSLVSAFEIEDLLNIFSGTPEDGISMCTETMTGSICQIMPNSVCEEDCLPGECVEIATSVSRKLMNVPEECELGTCQDPEEGICLPNSPKGVCRDDGGTWFNDPNGNVEECLKGCCVLGQEVQFITELQCQRIAEAYGMEFPNENAHFDSELNAELGCLMFAERPGKGACLFDVVNELEEMQEEKDCKFITEKECQEQGGQFQQAGQLCSHLDLNSVCEEKDHTGCIEGFDEIYLFDSCGNVENIYGTDEAGKWGWLIPKQESCEVGIGSNLMQNQRNCGNCNRLFGSVCGNETNGQELDDEPDGGVVCLDLGCYENGVRREHGETWCVYQTNFGVFPEGASDSGLLKYASESTSFLGGMVNSRSIAPPGSQFFRKSCNEGEIEIEGCLGARGGICVETREPMESADKEISVASCRLNRWQECVNYNPPDRGEGLLGKLKVETMMMKCNKDPDCFVKNVDIDKDFSFPVCLPKYPPGFNLGEGDSGGEAVCGYASQVCPVVFVKEAVAMGFGGAKWVCKANCDCVTDVEEPDDAQPSSKFINEMSAFCTSLGDCGLKSNYKGEPGGSGGFSLKKCVTEDIEGECKKRMPTGSMSSLLGNQLSQSSDSSDIEPVPGKYIDAGDLEEFAEAIGGSTSEDSSILSDLLDNGGSGGGGGPDMGLYQGDDLPWIGGVAGATTLGMHGAAQAGWLSTSTTTSAIFTSEAAASAATQGATAYNLVHEGGMVSGSITTNAMGPAMQAFSGGLVGASLAVAAVAILISVSGIGPGLGSAGTYTYLGAGAVGGGMAGVGLGGLPTTFAAGTAIEGGTVLAADSVVAAGSNLGQGAYQLVSTGMQFTVPEGSAIIAVETTAVAEGGGAIGAGGGAAGPGGAATPGMAGAPVLLVVGIVILVIVFTMLILNIVMGVGDMKKVEVIAECKPWQPPIGSSSEVCNSCGDDDFPCNDYACSSLGSNCGLIGEYPNVVCEDVSHDDVSAPGISVSGEELQESFEIVSSSDSGFEIKKQGERECLEDFESVTFGIETDEYAWCKLGLNPESEFEDMIYFGGDNSLHKTHTHTLGSLEIVNYFNELGQPLESEEETDISVFVKCQDAKGNTNPEIYTIDLCVIRADWTAPLLTHIDLTGGYLPYGTEETDIIVRSNEPVDLRWSFSDVDFDEMENRFFCSMSESITNCITNLVIDSDDVWIYVRGRDHPEWSGSSKENERNENQESLMINLRRTKNPLSIDSVVPQDGEVIVTGLPVVTVNIEARVSGGHDESISCYIGEGRVDSMDLLSEGVYTKAYDRFREGTHTLVIECEDAVGNRATSETLFSIIKDNSPTNIARVYDDSGTLVVITKEDATCGFKNSRGCIFNVLESELMEGEEKIHRTSFNREETYYIKCRDAQGNERTSKCDIIVTGGML